MMVYVLEGHIAYEGHITLGVYSSRAAAEAAAHEFERANRAQDYPTDYDYQVNVVQLDAAAKEYVYAVWWSRS